MASPARLLLRLGAALAALATTGGEASAHSFETMYRQLVEIDTSWPGGNCTAASEAMAEAMRHGGFPADALHAYADPAHPREGGLVAILKGSDPAAKALLLVAHVDVVAADAREWTYPPFALTLADGYYHGRGTSDNKAMAAALVEALTALHAEGYRPRRDVKIALTCGEEDAAAFNGAAYLAVQRRDLIDAALAFVPSAGGLLDERGQAVTLTFQAGEKAQQNFRITAIGTPSHASRPTGDNAIDTLAHALLAVSGLRFPVMLLPVARDYLGQIAAQQKPEHAAAVARFLTDPEDQTAAGAVAAANPHWNALIRTTCTATVIETGQQRNTVAQAARATINCRLLPGAEMATVQQALEAAIADGRVTVTALEPLAEAGIALPLTPDIVGPVASIARDIWPHAQLVSGMLTGATDARHFNAVGIPAYGITAMFNDPDGNGVHAPDERIRVRSVDEGRRFVRRLIETFSR